MVLPVGGTCPWSKSCYFLLGPSNTRCWPHCPPMLQWGRIHLEEVAVGSDSGSSVCSSRSHVAVPIPQQFGWFCLSLSHGRLIFLTGLLEMRTGASWLVGKACSFLEFSLLRFPCVCRSLIRFKSYDFVAYPAFKNYYQGEYNDLFWFPMSEVQLVLANSASGPVGWINACVHEWMIQYHPPLNAVPYTLHLYNNFQF